MATLGKSTFYGNAAAAMRQVMRGGKPGAPVVRPDPSEQMPVQPIPYTYAAVPVMRSESQTVEAVRQGGMTSVLRALGPAHVYTSDIGQPTAGGAAMAIGTTSVPQAPVQGEGPTPAAGVSQTAVTQPTTVTQISLGNVAPPPDKALAQERMTGWKRGLRNVTLPKIPFFGGINSPISGIGK